MVCKASDEHRYNASSLRLQCDNRNRVCGMGCGANSTFQSPRVPPDKERLILTRPLREDELRLSFLEQLPCSIEDAPALAPGTEP